MGIIEFLQGYEQISPDLIHPKMLAILHKKLGYAKKINTKRHGVSSFVIYANGRTFRYKVKHPYIKACRGNGKAFGVMHDTITYYRKLKHND